MALQAATTLLMTTDITVSVGTTVAELDRIPSIPDSVTSRRPVSEISGVPDQAGGPGRANFQSGAPDQDAPVRFGHLRTDAQRAKVMRREAIVRRAQALIATGTGLIAALQQACSEHAMGHWKTARRWFDAYTAGGLDALVEQKQGRVGRRAFVSEIPQELLDQAKAASIEHGTLGPAGRQNIAHAVRSTLLGHPDLPVEARRHLHGGHQSKSYVPATLRDALRVSPQARAIVQGDRSEALATPFTPTDWSAVPAGRVLTGDDMTANCYVWVEWPGALGYIVVRPQIIALLDCGSLRWVAARVVIRSRGQYNTDDVWGTIGDALSEFGVWPEYLWEGGAIWQGAKMHGLRTGISNDDRFGGLRSLGAKIRHSRSPRSKPIEQAFNELQYASDSIPGYCGRSEREDNPDNLQPILAKVRAGKLHPRDVGLPHLSEYSAHVNRCMARLNAERNDGKILRGQSPDEKWATDAPALAAMSPEATWLFRSDMRVVTVRRDGQVHISTGSGKGRMDHYYRSADVLMPLAGQRVIVYWNDSNPSADAVIIHADTRAFAGLAHYVEPIPRFDASPEQMHERGADLRAYHLHARSETVVLKPHFQRAALGRTSEIQTSGDATSSRVPSGQRCGLVLDETGNVQDRVGAVQPRVAAALADSERRQLDAEMAASRTRQESRRVTVTEDEMSRVFEPLLGSPTSEDTTLSDEESRRLFGLDSDPAAEPQ